MAAREGAGRLRWPLSAALRSVHNFRDIKSATFDVLAAGSLHGHVHVRACTFDPGGVPPVRMCLCMGLLQVPLSYAVRASTIPMCLELCVPLRANN